MKRKLKNVRLVGRIGKCENEECENFGKFSKVSKKDGRNCGRCGRKRTVFIMVERKEDKLKEFVEYGRYNTEWSKKDLDEDGRLILSE